MIRGLYTAASGMMTQQRRHDTVTNNMTNINTPGYKSVTGAVHSFPEMMLSLMGGDQGSGRTIGRLNTGVFAEESRMLFNQGDLMQTNQSGDFALLTDLSVPGVAFDASGKGRDGQGNVVYKPEAFFTVREGNEVRFTRDGHFRLNERHELTTADGALVLNRNQAPIVLPAIVSLDDVKVNDAGRMYNVHTGTPIVGADLLVSRIENPNMLIRTGNGRFRLDAAGAGQATAIAWTAEDQKQVQVQQGYLERSNVDPTQSMADMMTAFRAYEANQKVVQFYDKTLDKTVNEVGRV
ncbi:flagellar hook-basal body protein [Paenibacillus alvei]|uniref:flagellar hook-basal body protein n=1 Tax=Paenibacillus alvei TaxID=44250 RepID=UPI000288ED0A|nr:flagellar hook-basal body protein [Paenibacillus alvei]EJW18440.1 flagellar hook-basal body complex protein FlhO [Paenibacillus alvei DSM 29]MCY9539610.1 flagellar hook-basal body protein [Paenibacillus alvei]MCY9703132.1 flagellar hook-basal body protein [Paenibacillus alvei]MCY9735647.1 flagellar hook-basal body protein [Paenibacillus alvei]MCY9752872.1 flagellar hook-basal body protein [Paenibacillus alvei]